MVWRGKEILAITELVICTRSCFTELIVPTAESALFLNSVDAVVICSPTTAHEDQIQRCLKAGEWHHIVDYCKFDHLMTE